MNDQYPISYTPEAESLPTGTVFALFNGRDDAKQSMVAHGYPGPVIGPVRYVHTAYGGEIDICLIGEEDETIKIPIVEGCASFQGKFYGDWTVHQHAQRRKQDVPVQDDRRKA